MGFVGGIETISVRTGCNSVVSEIIPLVKSLENAPRDPSFNSSV